MKYKLTIATTEDDRYLTLLRIGRNKENPNEVELWCQFSGGVAFFEILVPNWELGYDFFSSFESYCVKYLKSHFFQDRNRSVELKLLDTYIHLSKRIEKWKTKKLKDEPGIRLAPTILCNICRHRINFNTCKAFPKGIPDEWDQNELHTTPHPKQEKNNEITFELGEAGSRCANIQPISSIKILSSRFETEETMTHYMKIRSGLLDEEFVESSSN